MPMLLLKAKAEIYLIFLQWPINSTVRLWKFDWIVLLINRRYLNLPH